MGSYEPGEVGERVGLMGALIVSVVDLMGTKGEAVEKFKRSNTATGALGPPRNRKRRTPVGGQGVKVHSPPWADRQQGS
jgi:hypothetical protein